MRRGWCCGSSAAIGAPLPPPDRLPLSHAVALGALHGPAELLPISSSGHVTLVPWLLHWDHDGLAPELRKAFEVALHAGTAAALMLALRAELTAAIRDAALRRATLAALAALPPAAVGYALERPIERRLGRPGQIATGLVAGAFAIALADRCPQQRADDEANATDALWLGLAQACALVPGVSRGGATLAAARVRRFRRADSSRLSRHVALPVIAGATALKAQRLRRRGLPAGALAPLVAGATAAFASTLGSARLIPLLERDRSLLPYALYRLGLGTVVFRRLHSERSSGSGA